MTELTQKPITINLGGLAKEGGSNPILPRQDEGCNVLPLQIYPGAAKRWGTKNVELALIFVAGIVDPIRGLAILLDTDDESIFDVIEAAFSANKRLDLNSETWVEKLADAVETVRYSMQLPLVLLPNGTMRVCRLNGDTAFEGSDWDLVRWVRDEETVMIDKPDLKEPEEALT